MCWRAWPPDCACTCQGTIRSTSFSAGQRRIRSLFYPVAYLFRSTPAVLIGLVAAAVLGWRRQWPLEAPTRRRSALGLALFALLVAVIMTLGAKKFDRYISPVFMALDIVAALGLLGLVQVVLGWWRRWRSHTSPGEPVPSPSNLGPD